ncbi:MAG TPA: TonB-dependent siderophore receptor [Terracidiphilus sp.]|jgi:iron complex outermembrane receptor protein|nr:TonB-dependent siderophore receptor [Terracidiphilus sp.]
MSAPESAFFAKINQFKRGFPQSFLRPVRRGSVGIAFLAGIAAVAAIVARSQAPDQLPGPIVAEEQKPVTAKLPQVNTTVVVHGEVNSDYLPESIAVRTLDGLPLEEAPLSATVVTRDLMNNQAARLLADVVKNDASIDDDYVPVGYYGDFEIRGFPIDLATGLEVNGMTIAGEQDVPLENKERVELLKGLAGVESGVTSGGGLINFATKRPATIVALDAATDQRGTAYAAADLGRLFGSRKQVGVRVNLAGERIEPYMNDTQGWRGMGAGAVDWKLSSKAMLKSDFEYQHKVERDGSGYQLLGGTALPDIHRLFPSTMLGEQSWAPPDTYDVFNTSARLDYTLTKSWAAYVQGSFSHSLINDNVMYAYGSSIDPATYAVTCPNAPDAPAYFFCPDGTYGIYDYRDPGELRIDGVGEAIATGHLRTGPVTQDLVAGGTLFLRSVQQPGFYSTDNPYAGDGIVQDGAVYSYVGAENIYQPIAPTAMESPVESAGPRRLWEDSHQASGLLQDRVRLPGRIQLIAGGRYDSLRDHNYSAYASCTDFSVPANCAPAFTNEPVWLPQYAAVVNPIAEVTLYANYGTLLSLGPQGPWWVDNASQFLAPYHTRQVELGAKYEPGRRILLSTGVFHMRAPFFYPKAIQSADAFCTAEDFGGLGSLCFESQGRETHNGVELSAEGKAASWLRLSASAMAIRAEGTNTGTSALDGKQLINVPHLHATVFADVAIPHMRGFYLMPGWNFSGRKEATRDDTVSVPSVNMFNLGARYTPGGEQGRLTFRLFATNVANKRYWSDTGASYGDSFLWLGAPATIRMAAHYTF